MNREQTLLVKQLNKDLQLQLTDKISMEELTGALAIHINQLIIHHFEQLVALLYQVDVNERKLKQLLQENKDSDAGLLIARLIIERQLQKIKTRSEYAAGKTDDAEEKW